MEAGVPRPVHGACDTNCHCLDVCRDYLTGFRKRKQQRRKEALSKLEKQAKQQRLEERAEVG